MQDNLRGLDKLKGTTPQATFSSVHIGRHEGFSTNLLLKYLIIVDQRDYCGLFEFTCPCMFRKMVLMLFLIWLGFKALEYAGFIDLKDPRNWRGLPIWWLNLTTGIVGIFQPFEAIWACEKPKPDPKDRFRNQKLLFVCNHQLSAFDVPLLLSVVYLETGTF